MRHSKVLLLFLSTTYIPSFYFFITVKKPQQTKPLLQATEAAWCFSLSSYTNLPARKKNWARHWNVCRHFSVIAAVNRNSSCFKRSLSLWLRLNLTCHETILTCTEPEAFAAQTFLHEAENPNEKWRPQAKDLTIGCCCKQSRKCTPRWEILFKRLLGCGGGGMPELPLMTKLFGAR